ncbi:teicoplanin resistance protein VanZ [Chryseobacterium sp. T16E-39]|uniref:VanZ family protein n=1 Tax=Chryseobacterium sp. T16E-39 TaxID=2015076 RepID=UPI000B5B3C72|nr:VanZ family protein [Chryseobacterium sp. T16E-39]ASK30512.1 teicoplanin resistance protein VanZ [Chryseobacterium sp. T16E-39]
MLKKFYKLIILPYTLVLLYLMFLGMGRTQYEDNVVRMEPVLSTLWYIKETILWKDIVTVVLGNVVMFVPFGFLGWVFPKLSSLKNLVFTFLSAIIIVEALQYFTRMGICEVDDVILNTLGVCLGWLMCRWIERNFSRLVL